MKKTIENAKSFLHKKCQDAQQFTSVKFAWAIQMQLMLSQHNYSVVSPFIPCK